MTRVLSALVLLPAVLGIAWFLPPIYTTILLGAVVALAFEEYARIARLGSEGFPRLIAGAATLATYVGVWAGVPAAMSSCRMSTSFPAAGVIRATIPYLFPPTFIRRF